MLLIEPRSRDKAFADHAASCPDCARQVKLALRFEDKLHAALNFPSPDGLESRMAAARSSASSPRKTPALDARWLGIAAGVLLAIGVAGWMGNQWEYHFGAPSGLELAVISHINDELDHLHEDNHVGPHALARLLLQLGADIDGDVGRVNFASLCAVRRHLGLHMVVPGRQGPITVLVMPEERLLRPVQVRSSRFSGLIVPAGPGSMAVVGEKQEPALDQVVEKMQEVIVWEA